MPRVVVRRGMTTARPHDTEPSLIGTVIGHYRITAALGSGGMGEVYRARHEIIGREAAVKLLRPEMTANPQLVHRFFNEARAATAIRHPGIIEVFDFGHYEDGRAYLVMEFLEGETLAERIKSRGRLSEMEAGTIARGIASALTAAHAKGIIHRDLKPDNVFLVPDPEVPNGERAKVLDFGIAKLSDSAPGDVRQTRTGALMGTPLYMAPEQARAAGEIDLRADLYSLGCMLYEMLVGQPPFVAVGAGEIIAMQMFSEPEPPSARLVEISPEMEHIVMRLLEKEPAARFQRASEVTEALSAIVGRLSARLSAPLPATNSSQMPIMPTPVPGMAAGSHIAMAAIEREHRESRGPMSPIASRVGMPAMSAAALHEGPPQMVAKRSAMPIIAGVLTIAIAGAAAAFVVTRGHTGDNANAATGSGGDSGSAGTPSADLAAQPPTTPTNANPTTPTHPTVTSGKTPDTKPDPKPDAKPDKPDARDKRDKNVHDAVATDSKHSNDHGTHGSHGSHPDSPSGSGPVTAPALDNAVTEPVVAPHGPQTDKRSPIETSLGTTTPPKPDAPKASDTPKPVAPKADPPPAPAPKPEPDPAPAKEP